MEENKYVYKKPKKKITPFAIFNTICAAQNTIARNKRAIWIFCIIDILL